MCWRYSSELDEVSAVMELLSPESVIKDNI